MSTYITKIEVEAYSLISNVDESILRINPLLIKDGYEFLAISLAEIEAKFHSVFSFPYNPNPQTFFRDENNNKLSVRFQAMLQNHEFSDNNTFSKRRLFFLKEKNDLTLRIENNVILDNKEVMAFRIADYTHKLIHKLRLFKIGDIGSPISFLKEKEGGNLLMSIKSPRYKNYRQKDFHLEEKDIEQLTTHLKLSFVPNELTNLAYAHFMLTYENFDARIKFLNLMSALESIFNLNPNQISHTMARHLSIVLSSNAKEFQENYKRIKNLYNIRSKISHGQSTKKKIDLDGLVEQLGNDFRKVIKFCLDISMNKRELFDYLNTKGFHIDPK
ncbi:MAG: hypothetical protein AAF487_10750 [Bacteroidota bacterium]